LAMAMVCSMNCVAASAADAPKMILQDKQECYDFESDHGDISFPLEVKSDEPYVKVWCGNTSTHTYSLSIVNANNEVMDSTSVQANSNVELYCSQAALPVGWYTVVIQPQDGYLNVTGSLAIRTASVDAETLAQAAPETIQSRYASHKTALDNCGGEQEIKFTITATEPYVKVWCSNTSAHAYDITVYNSSNVQIDYNTAQPNHHTTLFCNQAALPAGEYRVVVHSENSYPLAGSVAIRTSETKFS
jgi:hypothetical protein